MWEKHILAEFDEVEQIQRCIICGEIIHNYKGVLISSTDPDFKLGWKEGEHYIKKGNPTQYMSYEPINEGSIKNCNE